MTSPARRIARQLLLKTLHHPSHVSFFFVRGHMRSGTNWIGNLLNLHPRINCTGEFHLQRARQVLDELTDPAHPPGTMLVHEPVRFAATAAFEAMVRRCIVEAADRRIKLRATLYGDRTPAPIEPLLLRGCPHILAVRDVRDVVVSATFHFLKLPELEYDFKLFPPMRGKKAVFQQDTSYFARHPHELLDDEPWVRARAADWSRHVAQDQRSELRAARGELDASIHVVRYEQLLADTERLRNEMYRFLGVDPRQAAPLDERTRPGFEREDPQSHYRKGVAGDWRKYFTPDTARWVKEEAGEQLIALGYEESENW